MKPKEIYSFIEDDYPISVSGMGMVMAKATAMGIKELELDEQEYERFIEYFGHDIPYDINLVDGEVVFWGVRVTKIK